MQVEVEKDREVTPKHSMKKKRKGAIKSTPPGGRTATQSPITKFAKGDQNNVKHVVEGHIVASGEVTGIAGEETFHTQEIPQPLVRVLVKRVYEDVPLLMPNAEGDQSILSHVLNENTLWNARYLRKISKQLNP
ncbi:unnamed protein product [Calypogeia fissa]